MCSHKMRLGAACPEGASEPPWGLRGLPPAPWLFFHTAALEAGGPGAAARKGRRRGGLRPKGAGFK